MNRKTLLLALGILITMSRGVVAQAAVAPHSCRFVGAGDTNPASMNTNRTDTAEMRVQKLRSYLLADNTNKFPYLKDASNDASWFVCNHFATQLFLRFSSFASPEKFGELESKTPLRFSADGLPKSERFPLFYASMGNVELGYYHAINALYLGTDDSGYTDIKNYVLIEPQNDIVYPDVPAFLRWYLPTATTSTLMTFSINSGVGHTTNGSPQYLTEDRFTFECMN